MIIKQKEIAEVKDYALNIYLRKAVIVPDNFVCRCYMEATIQYLYQKLKDERLLDIKFEGDPK